MSSDTRQVEADDSYDENLLNCIKQQICLNNTQLLELTYNDQKFYQKLAELNSQGCKYLESVKYHEALIYLNEAEKVLEYAASCGKTIERNLIITTLNNEAALYQRAWELEKAASYIEAIIYNIGSFFESEVVFEFSPKIADSSSTEYEDFSIYMWRKKSLAIYYMIFCAISSQNKNNESAFNSAKKAVNLLKEFCRDCSMYEKEITKRARINSSVIDEFSRVKTFNSDVFEELGNIKNLDSERMDFQKNYNLTLQHIAAYLYRVKQNQNKFASEPQKFQEIRNKFSTYSIGHIMHLGLIDLQTHCDRLNMKEELSDTNKQFMAIYVSAGHFILATELRLISTSKYTLDENERKNSIEYKQSQIYHLYSIMLVSRYLQYESNYFEHVIGSFRNHYKIDILEDGKSYLENNQLLIQEGLIGQLSKVTVQGIALNSNIYNQSQSSKLNGGEDDGVKKAKGTNETEESPDVYESSKQSDQVTVKEYQKTDYESHKMDSPKVSRHHLHGNSTAVKKTRKKNLSKSQVRLHTNTFENEKEYKKSMGTGFKEKENKATVSGRNKSSRSKQKNDFVSKKKLQVGKKTANDHLVEKDVKYSDYVAGGNKSRSKSKNLQRNKGGAFSLYQENDKKHNRKNSYGDLRKTKLVHDGNSEQYGVKSGRYDNELEVKNIKSQKVANSRSIKEANLNLKKSKKELNVLTDRKGLGSPEVKVKKVKSPRNLKKI